MNLSPSNEKIKLIKKLAKRNHREELSLFLLEGKRAVFDAIAHGADILFTLSTEEADAPDTSGYPHFTTDQKTFLSLSQTQSPQNILAVARMIPYSLADATCKDKKLLVFCDSVQDPGNLGTIIRTADSAGAGGVILSFGCVDLYNPKVVRSTMSSIFNLPVVQCNDTKATLLSLKASGYKILAGALLPDAKSIYETDFSGKCVIVIGNEGAGVSDEVLSLCDNKVIIPMVGGAESLNASVSAGILIYEHFRHNM